jgi:UDP-N-acetyl-D-mannosaminuronate dehydrogenase
LHRLGAVVLLHDPLYAPRELASLGAEIVNLDGPLDVDAVVVQAYHSQYRHLDWERFRGMKVVFDGRGSLDPELVRQSGSTYLAVDVPAVDSPK